MAQTTHHNEVSSCAARAAAHCRRSRRRSRRQNCREGRVHSWQRCVFHLLFLSAPHVAPPAHHPESMAHCLVFFLLCSFFAVSSRVGSVAIPILRWGWIPFVVYMAFGRGLESNLHINSRLLFSMGASLSRMIRRNLIFLVNTIYFALQSPHRTRPHLELGHGAADTGPVVGVHTLELCVYTFPFSPLAAFFGTIYFYVTSGSSHVVMFVSRQSVFSRHHTTRTRNCDFLPVRITHSDCSSM
jgi:hypothetical protein